MGVMDAQRNGQNGGGGDCIPVGSARFYNRTEQSWSVDASWAFLDASVLSFQGKAFQTPTPLQSSTLLRTPSNGLSCRVGRRIWRADG